MKLSFEHKVFHFKRPSGTSRGVLTEKHAWILELSKEDGSKGIGECSVIPGLSPDFESIEQYESKLTELSNNLSLDLTDYPSILFGLESAQLDLKNGSQQIYFDNEFTAGKKSIPINGLIWMGDEVFMQEQINEKIKAGFTTIKMKIGAIDFDTEFKLLQSIRNKYSPEEITLRVDANGAFSFEDAIEKLNRLASLGIHSIEQPIKAGQPDKMKALCDETKLPIALDEELIGVNTTEKKIELLDKIQPQYIILKPSLHGGVIGTKEWISLAEERDILWWMTSALESNIGLNVICQLTSEYDITLPQGLGTGSLYTDNIPSQLFVSNGEIKLIPNDSI